MKTFRKLAMVLLSATALMAGAQSARSQVVLADVRADFVSDTTFPLSDSFGSGTWVYYASDYSDLSDKQTLTWTASTGDHNAFYGGPGSFNLPAVANTATFNNGAIPASNQVAFHPGNTLDADIQWTAGIGETGPLTLSGSFSRVGEPVPPGAGPGGFVDFTIYLNGVSVFSQTRVESGAELPFVFNFTSTVGTTIDFVLAHSNGESYFYNESLLSAQIATVPEPQTWQTVLGGAVVLGLLALRQRKAKIRRSRPGASQTRKA